MANDFLTNFIITGGTGGIGDTGTSLVSDITCSSDSTTSITYSHISAIANSAINSLNNAYSDKFSDVLNDGGRHKLPKNMSFRLDLPDGHVIKVDKNSNFVIEDKNAKVIHKACGFRGFNRYLNASDLIEEFIRFVGKLGCRQSQVLKIPLRTFIDYLIIRSAETDGIAIPAGVPQIETHLELKMKNRCLFCQRFVCHKVIDNGFSFCDGTHAQRYWKKISA